MECRVEFDYEAQESDELDLKKGDLITNVVTKMDGWWEGTLGANGKRGMFPDNFVKVVTSHSSSSGDEIQSSGDAVKLRKKSGTSLSQVRRLRALFSYSPEQEDELHLEVGDEVDFIAEVEEGWWRGQLKGRTGIFPSNFVAELESTPTPAATLNGNKDLSKGEYGKQNEHKSHGSLHIKVPPDVVPSEKLVNTGSTDEDPAPKLPPKPGCTKIDSFAPTHYDVQSAFMFGSINVHEVSSSDADESIRPNYKPRRRGPVRKLNSLSTPPSSTSGSASGQSSGYEKEENISSENNNNEDKESSLHFLLAHNGFPITSSPTCPQFKLHLNKFPSLSPHHFYTSTPIKDHDSGKIGLCREAMSASNIEFLQMSYRRKEARNELYINNEFLMSKEHVRTRRRRFSLWDSKISSLATIPEMDESVEECDSSYT